ncbi:hypothetical protein, partial [Paenibacillus donghaensis]|uniref:hypothetical protein n=1 Tax=Paenibacillus donghaensis TaxID=414771 RepID=UPI001D16E782
FYVLDRLQIMVHNLFYAAVWEAELLRKCILLTMNDLIALRKKKKPALSQAFYPNQAIVS